MTADDNVYWYDSQALNDSETSIWSQLNATIFLDPDVKPTSSEDEDSSTLQDDDDSELSSGSTFTKTLLESTSQDELGSLMISSADYVPPDMSEGSSQAASPTPAPVSEWQLIRRDAPSSGAIEDISDAPSNYLIAVVANKDAKFASNSDPSSTSNDDDDDKKNHGKSLTGLAMIILYAITGASVPLLSRIFNPNRAYKRYLSVTLLCESLRKSVRQHYSSTLTMMFKLSPSL